MAHDVTRSFMWLFTFSINLALKHLQIPTHYNCKYQPKDVIRALTYLSLQSDYAHGGLGRLTRKLRRARKQHKPKQKRKTPKTHAKPSTKRKNKPTPQMDSDTFLYRLEKLNRHTAASMLAKLNHEALLKAKQKGAFAKKVILAIDLTFIPYYGKITRWVNGGKRKDGTSYFHVYATLRVVSAGCRFTIKAIPIKRGCLDAESMAKTLDELLLEAKRLNLKVELVLLDKGFCWQEILLQLKASGYRFLVAVKKDKKAKEVILDYFRSGKGQVRRFSKGKGEHRVMFNLTIHRFKKRRRKPVKNILELYGAFATNLGFKEAVRIWDKIPEYYRKRWA